MSETKKPRTIERPIPITTNRKDGGGFDIDYAEQVEEPFPFVVGGKTHLFVLTQQGDREIALTHKMSGCRVTSANGRAAAERKLTELIAKHGATRVNQTFEQAAAERASTIAAAVGALRGKKR